MKMGYPVLDSQANYLFLRESLICMKNFCRKA